MINSDLYLNKVADLKFVILKELFNYFGSQELARVYNYTFNSKQINHETLQDKIIKQNCREVYDWFLNKTEQSIIAKDIILFVDARRSLVPYHCMYFTKLNNYICNEDCIFDERYFKETLNLRSTSTYGLGIMIIKPGICLKYLNENAQPYTNMYSVLLHGKNVFIKTDYVEKQPIDKHVCYYRSNVEVTNEGDQYAILFHSAHWMYNKIDTADNFLCRSSPTWKLIPP